MSGINMNILIMAVAMTALSACSATDTLIGADEFLVISQPPLSLPPDYNLRPPSTGKAQPIELEQKEKARAMLFGERVGTTASKGERFIVSAAGGDRIDPSLRMQIDYEAATRISKNSGFTNRILEAAGILDPQAEAERLAHEREAIKQVTGGAPVIIMPGKAKRKLPGT